MAMILAFDVTAAKHCSGVRLGPLAAITQV